MPDSHWSIGDTVHDRDDDDPSTGVVINLPGVRADEWDVSNQGTTVAEDNPDYPADAPVVSILFEDYLAEEFPDWERDEPISHATLNERDIYCYTFPAPRLEPAEFTDTEAQSAIDSDSDPDPDPEPEDESERDSEDASEGDTETGTETAPEPPAAVRALEQRLTEGGMDTDIEDNGQIVRATKLGETYRVRPDEVVEGEGVLRNHLEEIVTTDNFSAIE